MFRNVMAVTGQACTCAAIYSCAIFDAPSVEEHDITWQREKARARLMEDLSSHMLIDLLPLDGEKRHAPMASRAGVC